MTRTDNLALANANDGHAPRFIVPTDIVPADTHFSWAHLAPPRDEGLEAVLAQFNSVAITYGLVDVVNGR